MIEVRMCTCSYGVHHEHAPGNVTIPFIDTNFSLLCSLIFLRVVVIN